MGNVTPFILIACGFVIALLAGAWFVAPAAQRLQRIGRARRHVQRTGTALFNLALPVRALSLKTDAVVRDAAARVRAQRSLIIVLGTIVLAPLVIAIALQNHRKLEGFDDRISDQDAVIAALLQGEQLIPPPPLPPEIFTTAEVALLRPSIGFASREWDRLDHDFQQRLLQIFKIMEQRYGYRMALIEGYRSPQRQASLAAMGSHVTNAGAYQSYHQVGLGADCAFYRDGKLIISEKDPWAMRGYQLYGELAQAFGLTWGGNWKMLDFGHVELRKPEVLRRARAAAQ